MDNSKLGHIFGDSALAQKVFYRVTSARIDILDLDVSRQRLDSTHIYSDMATFGRTKLMRLTIRRFLKQLKRQDTGLFGHLVESLVVREASILGKILITVGY